MPQPTSMISGTNIHATTYIHITIANGFMGDQMTLCKMIQLKAQDNGMWKCQQEIKTHMKRNGQFLVKSVVYMLTGSPYSE